MQFLTQHPGPGRGRHWPGQQLERFAVVSDAAVLLVGLLLTVHVLRLPRPGALRGGSRNGRRWRKHEKPTKNHFLRKPHFLTTGAMSSCLQSSLQLCVLFCKICSLEEGPDLLGDSVAHKPRAEPSLYVKAGRDKQLCAQVV